jgi:hypothetical protein
MLIHTFEHSGPSMTAKCRNRNELRVQSEMLTMSISPTEMSNSLGEMSISWFWDSRSKAVTGGVLTKLNIRGGCRQLSFRNPR